MAHPLQRRHDPLEPVGDLDRRHVQRRAPHRLEVRELGHLLAVEPDLPAEAPGPEGRVFPVVLDEADVVLAHVDAEGDEGAQEELLRVSLRKRFFFFERKRKEKKK